MAALNRGHQENICGLVCWDDKYCHLIRGAVDVSLFEFPYDIICEHAFTYIDKYKVAPKDHIHDVLIDYLAKQKKGLRKQVEGKLKDLFDLSQKGINTQYTIDTLSAFVRQQTLKQGITAAAELILSRDGDDETMEEAERILSESMNKSLELFDAGVNMGDSDQLEAFFKSDADRYLPTGIPELDERRCGPVRGGVHLYIALLKMGKSWWMAHLAKMSLLNNYKVCHITLELSDMEVYGRYLQTFFAVPKREGDYDQTWFQFDSDKNLVGFHFESIARHFGMNEEARGELITNIEKWTPMLSKLWIKKLPANDTTLLHIETYLDNLEITKGFIPELLLIDYPDLMEIDVKYYRLDLGRIYKGLKSMAGKRNIAIGVVTQANKQKGKTKIDSEGAAEDFSKGMTVDMVMSYNQTDNEYKLNLARIEVLASRADEDKFTVLISQNYKTGQYCIDSHRMRNSRKDHFGMVSAELGEEPSDNKKGSN